MNKKQAYRDALDQLQFSQDSRQRIFRRLLDAPKTAEKPRRVRPLLTAPLVAAVCVLLLAAAAVPGVWKIIQEKQGPFSPYAQTVQGAVAEKDGIEVQVLSALADDVQCQVFYAVRDLTGDRLDQYLHLNGTLEVAEQVENSPHDPVPHYYESPELYYNNLISYDPSAKTALFQQRDWFGGDAKPIENARLRVESMSTQTGSLDSQNTVSCSGVTTQTLKSLPSDLDSIYSVSDPNAPTLVEDGSNPVSDNYLNYHDGFLPSQHMVLAPGQTPMSIANTQDITVSSLGFAEDGLLHIRLKFGPGVSLGNQELQTALGTFEVRDYLSASVLPKGAEYADEAHSACIVRQAEDGVDISFPQVTVKEAGQLDRIEFWGEYTRPGVQLDSGWTVPFSLDYHRSKVLQWTGSIGAIDISQVTVSPLTVTITSENEDLGGNIPLTALRKDGSTISLQPDTGSHQNIGCLSGGDNYWASFSTWTFPEPVKAEDLVSLTLTGAETVTIPVK